MDAVEILAQVEALYRQILTLTLDQEAILAGTDVSGLPTVVAEKFALLDQAQALLSDIGADTDRTAPAFQAGVEALRAVLAEVIASENRCGVTTAAPAAAAPPPRRVIAAYGGR